MDKPEYDRPDDKENTTSKTLVFLVLGLTVIVIFVFGIYR